MANRIDGTVVRIDDAGNLITDISVEQLAEVPRDESVTIKFGDHETVGLFPAGHDQPDATMVAVLGESGFLEIQIVGISLAEMLGIKVAESVAVSW